MEAARNSPRIPSLRGSPGAAQGVDLATEANQVAPAQGSQALVIALLLLNRLDNKRA